MSASSLTYDPLTTLTLVAVPFRCSIANFMIHNAVSGFLNSLCLPDGRKTIFLNSTIGRCEAIYV